MEAYKAIHILQAEIDWLQKVIHQVVTSYLMQEGHEKHWLNIPLPDLFEDDGPYAHFVLEEKLNVFDRLGMALAMAPHLRPEVLDIFFGKNQIYDRGFTEFGGEENSSHNGFLPTGQTLCFLIAAVNPELRYAVMDVLDRDRVLLKREVLILQETESHIPDYNGTLSMSNFWLHYFLTGEKLKMEHGPNFPAYHITTPMEWDDVILDQGISEQLMEIHNWLEYGHVLLKQWGLKKHIKPGYRALFYGPPGTGKTLTATLLGKASQRDVYKVDLAMMVSKYIGETEKNLARIFTIAENKDWILFFDEADALFGKRTATNSSNDRYANQQTAYLLQRIEDFPGVVILASNLQANLDQAFTRRFQSMIHFRMPSPEERYRIWKNAFSNTCSLNPEIDLWQIAEDYELAGGSIINVLRFCALATIHRNGTVVSQEELMMGIRREFMKENKTVALIN